MLLSIDIPKEDFEKFATICESKGLSISDGIEEAINLYINGSFFGVLNKENIDGLLYQNLLRSEWNSEIENDHIEEIKQALLEAEEDDFATEYEINAVLKRYLKNI